MEEEGEDDALEQMGRFSFRAGSVHARQKQRLCEIHDFFDEEVMERLLVPIVTQQFSISLRLLDYTMTNWAKKTRVMVEMNTAKGKSPWNLFSLYKDWLRFYRRRGFDPFRRRERVFFWRTLEDGSRERLDTTVAQLNFIRWAQKYGILDYVSQHKDEIEDDMMQTLGESKKRRQGSCKRPREGPALVDASTGRRKRAELSKAPSAKCLVYPIRQEIHFEAVEPPL
jgi:hypothetical protein